MAHSRELDINDDRIAYKSSVAAVPAALALAEKLGGVTGKDFIAAVCVGVDFGIRLGLATNPKPVHAKPSRLAHLPQRWLAAKFSVSTQPAWPMRWGSPIAAFRLPATARF